MNATTVRPVLSCLLLLATTLAPAAPSALAAPAEQAAGGAGVHFRGTFDLGSTPAAAGTSITVIVARSVDDVTICGTGSVSGGNGQFRGYLAPPPPWIPAGETQQSDEDQPQ